MKLPKDRQTAVWQCIPQLLRSAPGHSSKSLLAKLSSPALSPSSSSSSQSSCPLTWLLLLRSSSLPTPASSHVWQSVPCCVRAVIIIADLPPECSVPSANTNISSVSTVCLKQKLSYHRLVATTWVRYVNGCTTVGHTHTRLTALIPGLPGWASTRKVKPIWILLKQKTVSGSGIIWAICKSASRSRQITSRIYRVN